jgi:hypothetical protein
MIRHRAIGDHLVGTGLIIHNDLFSLAAVGGDCITAPQIRYGLQAVYKPASRKCLFRTSLTMCQA